jgi:hypothetical protein
MGYESVGATVTASFSRFVRNPEAALVAWRYSRKEDEEMRGSSQFKSR